MLIQSVELIYAAALVLIIILSILIGYKMGKSSSRLVVLDSEGKIVLNQLGRGEWFYKKDPIAVEGDESLDPFTEAANGPLPKSDSLKIKTIQEG